MATRIQFRRGKPAFWVDENPILRSGEPGYEIGTGNIKIGDGVTPWNDLDYYAGDSAGMGGGGGFPGPGDEIPDLVLFYENGKV